MQMATDCALAILWGTEYGIRLVGYSAPVDFASRKLGGK